MDRTLAGAGAGARMFRATGGISISSHPPRPTTLRQTTTTTTRHLTGTHLRGAMIDGHRTHGGMRTPGA
eukprot:12763244-Alexandrium_andersonii.AAC.1